MAQKTNRPVLEVVNSAKKPTGKKPDNTGGNGGSGASKEQRFGDYLIRNNTFHQIKMVKDGEGGLRSVDFPLCDFTCRIVEEVTSDDGLSDASYLRIEGKRSNGMPLRLADVLSKSFFSTQGSSINDAWGASPFIYPGAAKKDNLRACIQLYSRLDGDWPHRIVYKFTGWKKLNEQWHYLTGSGAITAEGLLSGTEVDLGAGHMSRYQLPVPLTGEALNQAAVEALALLEICPHKPHIGMVLLAAVARAPLGECCPSDFAIWLQGLTGSRKSAVAAIALAFFGPFTARSFPSNWSDTVLDCEIKSHQAKDAVFVVDDFKPSVSQNEANKLHAMAERIIRNTGNQAGRGYRGSDRRANAAPYNRSMMIVTGEDLPRGQSLLGRLLILELSRTDVNNDVLTRLQRAATSGCLAGLMSAYLQWLASRLDQFKTDFPMEVELCRNAAIRDGFASSHPRVPEIYANLLSGADVFLEFLEGSGALSWEQRQTLLPSIDSGLQQAFREQSVYQIDQDEVERFLQLLRAALSSGGAHIACRLKLGPPEVRPYSWGWRDAGTDMAGDKNFNPMGDCMGYYASPKDNMQAEVWLQQDTAYKIAQQFARSQGDSFLLSAASLWRRMHDRGLIIHAEPNAGRSKPRLDVKRTVAGQSKRLMVLAAELIETG
ncbi:MAG: cell wall-binding protein [Methylobacter sp.]